MDGIINFSDFLIKSAINTTIVKYGEKLFSRFPSTIAHLPVINLIAISVLGDFAEYYINFYFQHHIANDSQTHYEQILSKAYLGSTLLNIFVRTVIGAGVLTVGALVTGSALLPAVTLGATTGALMFLINKVSKYSLVIFKFLAIICVAFAESASTKIPAFKDLTAGFKASIEFIKKSIPKQTKLEINGVCNFFGIKEPLD